MTGLPITMYATTGQVWNGTLPERVRLKVYREVGAAIARRRWRGMRRLRHVTLDRFAPEQVVALQMAHDSTFEFPVRDKYWSQLLRRGHLYEAPVHQLLLAIRAIDYTFLDCGANYGYWSVLASSEAFGSKRAIAIEASPANLDRLRRNQACNDGRFDVLHRAVYSRSGIEMDLFGEAGCHYGMSLVQQWGTTASAGCVRTISVDDALLEAGRSVRMNPVVVKLDIEGVEAKAMQGAERTRAGGALFIYEDYGTDADHAASAHMLGLGLSVFALTDEASIRMVRLADVARVKRSAWRGYNFAAVTPGSDFERAVDAARTGWMTT